MECMQDVGNVVAVLLFVRRLIINSPGSGFLRLKRTAWRSLLTFSAFFIAPRPSSLSTCVLGSVSICRLAVIATTWCVVISEAWQGKGRVEVDLGGGIMSTVGATVLIKTRPGLHVVVLQTHTSYRACTNPGLHKARALVLVFFLSNNQTGSRVSSDLHTFMVTIIRSTLCKEVFFLTYL